MSIDLTTFVLQILNFLVLLWLLHRYVYRPLRLAVEGRQAAHAAATAAIQQQAANLQAAQTALAEQQAAWAAHTADAQAQLNETLARDRSKRLAELERELLSARERGQARLQNQLEQQRAAAVQTLRHDVDALLRQHLAVLAGPDFEAVLIARFLTELGKLDAGQIRALCEHGLPPRLEVTSAYIVPDDLREQLSQMLRRRFGEVPVVFALAPELLSGIAVGLDGHVLELNLADSLDVLPENLPLPGAA